MKGAQGSWNGNLGTAVVLRAYILAANYCGRR